MVWMGKGCLGWVLAGGVCEGCSRAGLGGLEVGHPSVSHVGWEGWGSPGRGRAALGTWS